MVITILDNVKTINKSISKYISVSRRNMSYFFHQHQGTLSENELKKISLQISAVTLMCEVDFEISQVGESHLPIGKNFAGFIQFQIIQIQILWCSN